MSEMSLDDLAKRLYNAYNSPDRRPCKAKKCSKWEDLSSQQRTKWTAVALSTYKFAKDFRRIFITGVR